MTLREANYAERVAQYGSTIWSAYVTWRYSPPPAVPLQDDLRLFIKLFFELVVRLLGLWLDQVYCSSMAENQFGIELFVSLVLSKEPSITMCQLSTDKI